MTVTLGLVVFARVWDWWTEREDLSRWDVPAMAWPMAHRHPAITLLPEDITTPTAPAGMIVVSLLTVIIWLRRTRHWRSPALLAGAMAAAMLCIVGIKSVAGRGRPPITDMMMGADLSCSFPSGHTPATSTFVLVLLYPGYFRPRAGAWRDISGTAPGAEGTPRARWAMTGTGALVIALVAFSRLYLGYHWLTDVTASLLLATAILGLVVGVDAWRPTARPHVAASAR